MTLPVATILALAAQCAPDVAPETLLSVVHVESRLNPLAIGVNGSPRVAVVASDQADAVAKATALIQAGRSVDLGLAQINSRNLGWLGVTVEQVFEPCANLAAAARILSDGYVRSEPQRIGPHAALRTAFSYYNTGDPRRGFANGYVGKVARAAGHLVPPLAEAPAAELDGPIIAPPVAAPASWDVFGRAARAGSDFVFNPASPASGAAQ